MSGKFIVFEGVDRSGKSTQALKLAKKIPNSILMRFPDRTTPIGKLIDQYLHNEIDFNDETIHLLFSANRWEQKQKIENALICGQNVICDRYIFSGIAYSLAKNLPDDWCRRQDDGLPIPDIIFFLDIPIVHSSSRKDFGEEKYENVSFQKKVRQKFTEQFTEKWIIIDATRTIEDIHTFCCNQIIG